MKETHTQMHTDALLLLNYPQLEGFCMCVYKRTVMQRRIPLCQQQRPPHLSTPVTNIYMFPAVSSSSLNLTSASLHS